MKTNWDLPSCRMKRNHYLSLSGPSSVPREQRPFSAAHDLGCGSTRRGSDAASPATGWRGGFSLFTPNWSRFQTLCFYTKEP